MSSITETGLKGVLAGIQSASKHAEEAAQAFSPESDKEPVASLVALNQDEVQVKASAKVIKVGVDLSKLVVDLLA